ncbi:riboflavin biosynthesis protein RibF [Aerococcus viridans]|uniref:Riboflavin biosynthesis protein n=1 Tax=Aerococcus viridans TaxID=1377 RepID=A0A2N6UD99_9LACT|nr:riboflavin biosynthesis protein RibF [Aerococcus viridans]PMC79537.1 riboflavin biosynthesis protein RibF [Aerococcus viridans]
MKTINLHHPFEQATVYTGDIVLALGFFDGVHRGHQAVIKAARDEADRLQLPLAVMTFNMAPRIMYQQIRPEEVTYLTTLKEKERLMTHLGVDYLYVAQLTSAFSALKPQEFVDQYMVGLHAKSVVAGFDYTYGKKDLANMHTLKEHAAGRFNIIEVNKLSEDTNKVGSTEIRQDLNTGKIDKANQQLGYIYSNDGIVVHGEKRGRELGYPTANLMIATESLIPAEGVYIVEMLLNDQVFPGVASIGNNITFGEGRKRTVEIHLLDFKGEIYGEYVTVYWHQYLRPELKFDGIDGLIDQMDQDAIQARKYLEKLQNLTNDKIK